MWEKHVCIVLIMPVLCIICWPDQILLCVGLQCWLVNKSGTEGQSHIIDANSFIIQTSISTWSRWIFLMDRCLCSLLFGQMGWSGWSGFREDENWICSFLFWLGLAHYSYGSVHVGEWWAALPHSTLVPDSSHCAWALITWGQAQVRYTVSTTVL